jgi:hypothetical protein
MNKLRISRRHGVPWGVSERKGSAICSANDASEHSVIHLTHRTTHPLVGRATHALHDPSSCWTCYTPSADERAQRKAPHLSSSQLGPRDEHVRQQRSDTHAAELDRRHDGDASGGQVPPHDCRPPLRPHSHWATGIAQVTHANDCGHTALAMTVVTPLSQLITVVKALSPLVVQ